MKTGVKSYQPRPTGPRVECGPRIGFQVLGLRQMSPLFDTRGEAEGWLEGELAKMPAYLRPQMRACMRCSKGFESDGPHNRMCDECRAAASADTPVTFSFGAIHGRKRA